MSLLSGKNILLGVSAGIAAYKTPLLVRLFIKAGANVKVVMTPSAKDFVTPLTLSTLSKNEVLSEFTNEENENTVWNNHVDLALWADYMVIAPATANTMSKMANGLCDNLLLATYLSAKCKVYFAPAMDLDMYRHESSRQSIEKLKSFGNVMIPAAHGELASGLIGEGRMAEPEEIFSFIEQDILKSLPLRNKNVLITAGPTYEAIDPVRFIGNHSSGKMGYELAKKAASLGAKVYLISGPTALSIKNQSIEVVDVFSAQEMYEAAHRHFDEANVVIAAAAVADYRPKTVSAQKIKKDTETLSIELEKTKDILASLGAIKEKQILVGFALETENEIENAKKKLKKKNLDIIVLNSLNDAEAGFGKDTNKITLIFKNEEMINFEVKSKSEVSDDIFQQILKMV